MRKFYILILAAAVFFISSCSGSSDTKQTETPPLPSGSITDGSVTDDTPPSDFNPGITDDTDSPPEPQISFNPDDYPVLKEAMDATLFSEKETSVPLGQWVYFTEKNYSTGEYEPKYIRITRVSRNEDEVGSAIADYSGYFDLSLTDDQARDIEFGLLEYEVFFSPLYEAPYGITSASVSLTASPIYTVGFKTADGLSYIGVGNGYGVSYKDAANKVEPGEVIRLRCVYTVLKNYNESEYGFRLSWYEGEITSENERQTYFSCE